MTLLCCQKKVGVSWHSASKPCEPTYTITSPYYGGYVVVVGAEFAHGHGQWSVAEAGCSSTWRELKAVERVLFVFCFCFTAGRE